MWNWFEGEELCCVYLNVIERIFVLCVYSVFGVVLENDRCLCIFDRLLLWKIFVFELEYFFYVVMSYFVWVRYLIVFKLVLLMFIVIYLLNLRWLEI